MASTARPSGAAPTLGPRRKTAARDDAHLQQPCDDAPRSRRSRSGLRVWPAVRSARFLPPALGEAHDADVERDLRRARRRSGVERHQLTSRCLCLAYPGACVKSVDGPLAVKAEIQVRMGAMEDDVHGPRQDRDRVRPPAARSRSRPTPSKRSAELRDGRHHDAASATVAARSRRSELAGRQRAWAEGVIGDVLTNLVRSSRRTSLSRRSIVPERRPASWTPPNLPLVEVRSSPDVTPQPPKTRVAPAPDRQSPAEIFRSLTGLPPCPLDIKLTAAPTTRRAEASGESFAMLRSS